MEAINTLHFYKYVMMNNNKSTAFPPTPERLFCRGLKTQTPNLPNSSTFNKSKLIKMALEAFQYRSQSYLHTGNSVTTFL